MVAQAQQSALDLLHAAAAGLGREPANEPPGEHRASAMTAAVMAKRALTNDRGEYPRQIGVRGRGGRRRRRQTRPVPERQKLIVTAGDEDGPRLRQGVDHEVEAGAEPADDQPDQQRQPVDPRPDVGGPIGLWLRRCQRFASRDKGPHHPMSGSWRMASPGSMQRTRPPGPGEAVRRRQPSSRPQQDGNGSRRLPFRQLARARSDQPLMPSGMTLPSTSRR